MPTTSIAFGAQAHLHRPLTDLRQIGRAGRAIDERDAIEKESSRESAEQEILDRAFSGLARFAC